MELLIDSLKHEPGWMSLVVSHDLLNYLLIFTSWKMWPSAKSPALSWCEAAHTIYTQQYFQQWQAKYTHMITHTHFPGIAAYPSKYNGDNNDTKADLCVRVILWLIILLSWLYLEEVVDGPSEYAGILLLRHEMYDKRIRKKMAVKLWIFVSL